MRYPGGKNSEGVYQRIINQIPPHLIYVELFAGSAAVLRHKRPAQRSFALDLDPGAIGELRGRVPAGTTLQCRSAFEFLDTERTLLRWPATFLYVDPPYLPSTRRGGPVYAYELTKAQHRSLLLRLRRLTCPVMISGYWSQLYEDLLRGWRTDSFAAMTHGGRSTEWLWMNYPPPAELHDYRYLGADYREREKIRRQQRRWSARLARMSALQRYALCAAIAEQQGPGAMRGPGAIAGNNGADRHAKNGDGARGSRPRRKGR